MKKQTIEKRATPPGSVALTPQGTGREATSTGSVAHLLYKTYQNKNKPQKVGVDKKLKDVSVRFLITEPSSFQSDS